MRARLYTRTKKEERRKKYPSSFFLLFREGQVPKAREALGKGAFLTRPLDPDDLFMRDELSGEQLLFGQTAAEFMRKEVLPHEHRLYEHDWVLTRELLKKAADLDLLRLEIPQTDGGLGLDKVSAAYVFEYISLNPSRAC
jgi:Acyl-CoA dehydrogenase, N-terminal domain